MNPWRWVDPRVLSVHVADVRNYLLRQGWKLRPNPNANLLRFEKPAEGSDPPLFQMVPASEHFSDYRQRLTELITTLSEVENRHPVEVLNDILQPATSSHPAPVNGPSEPLPARIATP